MDKVMIEINGKKYTMKRTYTENGIKFDIKGLSDFNREKRNQLLKYAMQCEIMGQIDGLKKVVMKETEHSFKVEEKVFGV